jgi:high-affinity iron transporter
MSGSTRRIVILSLMILASLSLLRVQGPWLQRERPHVEAVRTVQDAASAPPPAMPLAKPLESVHRALGTLQYVMNDYALAVDLQGRILNAAEYEEQGALLEDVALFLEAHAPGTGARAHEPFRVQLAEIRDLVDARAEPWLVREAVASLLDGMIAAYGVRVAPAELPSIGRGAALYMEGCAACHGADGRGRTPVASSLDPRPTDLLAERVVHTLSPYQVFNVVAFGVDGTGMPAYPTLDEQERWDLAFFVLSLRHVGAGVAPRDATARPLPALEVLSRCSDAELAEWLQANGVHTQDVAAAVRDARLQSAPAP